MEEIIMGKKGVEDMITEIEIFLDHCKAKPLSNNSIIVPRDEIDSMLNEVKMKLPSEIERSKKIMRSKENILSDARTRADSIITEASVEARRLVDESQIVALANIRANEILELANQQAAAIVEAANEEAREIRIGTMEYTSSMLDNIESYVNQTLEVEMTNYANLIESMQNNILVLQTNKAEIQQQLQEFSQVPVSEEPESEEQLDSIFSAEELAAMEQQVEEEYAPEPSDIMEDSQMSDIPDDEYDDIDSIFEE